MHQLLLFRSIIVPLTLVLLRSSLVTSFLLGFAGKESTLSNPWYEKSEDSYNLKVATEMENSHSQFSFALWANSSIPVFILTSLSIPVRTVAVSLFEILASLQPDRSDDHNSKAKRALILQSANTLVDSAIEFKPRSTPISFAQSDLINEDQRGTARFHDEIEVDESFPRTHDHLHGDHLIAHAVADDESAQVSEEQRSEIGIELPGYEDSMSSREGLDTEIFTDEHLFEASRGVKADDGNSHDDFMRHEYSWERDDYQVRGLDSGEPTPASHSDPIQMSVQSQTMPVSIYSEEDSIFLIDPRADPAIHVGSDNFDLLLEYSKNCAEENTNEEQKAWARTGANVAERINHSRGLVDQARDAEKFADFVVRCELSQDALGRALNDAFLKWKHGGFLSTIPTADEIFARAF